MKIGTKALNTDIFRVMKMIVDSHVKHYQSDLEHDITALKEAAVQKERTERIFVWLCRPCGTWLLREKDVFIRGTCENNTFCFYAEQTKDDIQCFVVEVNSLDGCMVVGNLYVFDYLEYYRHVTVAAVPAGNIIADYEKGRRIIIPEAVFWAGPDYEFGNLVSYSFTPKSTDQLEMVLTNEKRIRECFKEDYQILYYELYEYPATPTDKVRYHSKTPILEQAETVVRKAKESGTYLFIKAICSDGKDRCL